jgi:hypothetical protein
MRRTEARLRRLEAQANPPKVVVVFAETGESSTDALLRMGHDPDAQGVKYVVVSWCKGDENL